MCGCIDLLTDDTLFLAHVDSTIFDANTDEPLDEIQKIIERVILTLHVNHKDIWPFTVTLRTINGRIRRSYGENTDSRID